ncbi:MAG TPA: chemotaxis protein CheW [Terriglobia bacterium]|nr:chemotaxis protein CheW [Terriglobia bacterium]
MKEGEIQKNDMPSQLVAFALDGQQYALRLRAVQQIVRMVEVTPLPKAPEIVLGVVNLQGKIIPVLNVRERFGLRDRETNLRDQLIVAQTAKRSVALVVDSVTSVIERSRDEITEAARIVPGAEYVEGVAKLEDGMLFIHDLDRFLSPEEEQQLRDVLTASERASK